MVKEKKEIWTEAKRISRHKITTIQIAEETREELKKLGKKGDTYDDIIRELLSKR